MTAADSHTPAGPADWYLRRLRPSDAWAVAVGWWLRRTCDRSHDHYAGGCDGGKDYVAGLVGAALVLWLAVLPSQATHALLLGAVFVLGVQMIGRKQRAGITSRPWGDMALTVLVVLLGIVGSALPNMRTSLELGGPPGLLLDLLMPSTHTLVSVALLAVCEWMARQPLERAPVAGVDARWYSHESIRDWLILAGVLPARDPAGELWTIGFRGEFSRTPYGEFQQIELPAPMTADAVLKKRPQLAAARSVPAHRLHVEHPKGKPPGYVVLGLLTERKELPAKTSLPDTTDWAQPTPIGHDVTGRPMEALPPGQGHLGLFGATGSGKSWTGRYLFSWPLLDARVSVAFISGKDVPEDWQPMRHLCVRYAGGAGEENIREALDVLRWVDRVAQYRTSLRPEDRLMLIVGIEEWHSIQLLADDIDKALGKELRSLVTRGLATWRALNIKVVLIQQSATVDSLPAVQRKNLTEKLVGRMERDSEIGYALGGVDFGMRPSDPGQFLYHRSGQSPVLVSIPPMDEQTFLDVVKRATRLRTDTVMPTAEELEGLHSSAPVIEVVDEGPRPDLTRAVHVVLRRHPDLTTSQLYDRLPEDVRGGGENTLGRWLKEVPCLEQVKVGERKNRAAWRYVPPPLRLPVALPPEEQPVPLDVALAAPGNSGHLPSGTPLGRADLPATGTDGPLLRAVGVRP